ncbi:MAG: peptidyl-prolyl cis-trans isomerase [Candidatus Rifleibacteriota bacterium]
MYKKQQRLRALIIFTFIMAVSCYSFVAAADKTAETKSPRDVLAEVGEIKITRADFNRELDTFVASADPKAAQHFSSQQGKKMFLNQICEIYALEKLANKMGIDKGEDFKEQVKEIAIARLAQETMQKAVEDTSITDAEVKSFYNENKDVFAEPASYHLFQISLSDPQKAAEIKKQLDSGKSFLNLAKKESEDDYKVEGGDRGFVAENSVSPVISNTLAQLKKDEVSAPLRVEADKYQLIKFTEKKEGEVKSFEDVEGQVRKEATANKQRMVYNDEINRLRKKFKFNLEEDALSLIKKPELSDEEQNTTLFTYADKEIKISDLMAELEQIPPFLRPQILSGKGLEDILNNFSARYLALEEAEQNYKTLAEEKPQVVEDARRRVAIRVLLDGKLGSIELNDKELKDYYNKNLAKFKASARMDADHILVKTEEEANKIYEQLKKNPEKFAEIAREKSICPSGKEGGKLGMFEEGQMVPEFDKACKEAKIGEIAGPVKTKFGYHIIRVNERTAAGTQEFAEVKEEIRAQILPQKQKAAFSQLVDEAKSEFNVKIYPEKL